MLRLRHLRDNALARAHRVRPDGDIRVHGNGFIQVDLNERKRLHVWGHPSVPRQRTDSQPHDHVFGFVSRTLAGRICNTFYRWEPDDAGPYQVWEPSVREGQDTVLSPTGGRGRLLHGTSFVLDARCGNDHYRCEAGTVHETWANSPAVTVIRKDGPTQAQGAPARPRVFCRVGEAPDNSFDRYRAMPPSLAWDAVREVLRLGGVETDL